MCHSAANENQAGGCVSACLLVAGRVTDSFESLEKDPVKKEARNVFWSCQAPPLGLCNVRVLEVYSDVGLYFTRPSTHVDSYKKP